jgi:hypothetical protein
VEAYGERKGGVAMWVDGCLKKSLLIFYCSGAFLLLSELAL